MSTVCLCFSQVQIAACDTFRSGAVEQLRTHCNRLSIPLYERGYEKDPAKVAYEAIKSAERSNIDVLLVDTAGEILGQLTQLPLVTLKCMPPSVCTALPCIRCRARCYMELSLLLKSCILKLALVFAGRMQDNEPLMRALSNLINLNEPDLTLFVGEALVGNDAVDQLTKFNQRLADLAKTPTAQMIQGLVLTKMDTIDDKVSSPAVFIGSCFLYVIVLLASKNSSSLTSTMHRAGRCSTQHGVCQWSTNHVCGMWPDLC